MDSILQSMNTSSILVLVVLLVLPVVYTLRISMRSSNPNAIDIINNHGSGKYLKGYHHHHHHHIIIIIHIIIITGKTAIVTGGNSGIGLETCKALASAGCNVILCSRTISNGNHHYHHHHHHDQHHHQRY